MVTSSPEQLVPLNTSTPIPKGRSKRIQTRNYSRQQQQKLSQIVESTKGSGGSSSSSRNSSQEQQIDPGEPEPANLIIAKGTQIDKVTPPNFVPVKIEHVEEEEQNSVIDANEDCNETINIRTATTQGNDEEFNHTIFHEVELAEIRAMINESTVVHIPEEFNHTISHEEEERAKLADEEEYNHTVIHNEEEEQNHTIVHDEVSKEGMRSDHGCTLVSFPMEISPIVERDRCSTPLRPVAPSSSLPSWPTCKGGSETCSFLEKGGDSLECVHLASPLYVKVDIDVNNEDVDDEDSDTDHRYKLRPRRKLFPERMSIRRYDLDCDSTEEEEDDDDEVVFYMDDFDDDEGGAMRRRSSYAGGRGPKADMKALSLVTNCPISVKWLMDNFEYHPGKSLPRGFVYDQYVILCDENGLEHVNAASFGKLIRSVFPGLKTRRLGTRGNSKYHYNGVYLKPASSLRSILNLVRTQQGLMYDNSGKRGRRVRKSYEADEAKEFLAMQEGEEMGEPSPDEYLGRGPEMERPLVGLMVDFNNLPPMLDGAKISIFESIYLEHCKIIMKAFEKFDLRGIMEEWRRFWRLKLADPSKIPENSLNYKEALPKPDLFKICSLEATVEFIMAMDLTTYQFAIDIIYPSLIRAMPVAMAQQLRVFFKDAELMTIHMLDGYPKKMAKMKLRCLRVFTTMWNDYARLNRMVKSTGQTIRSEDSVQAMKSELGRALNFKAIEDEAAVYLKPSAWLLINKLIVDFYKNLHENDQTMESWVYWVDSIVQKMSTESDRQLAEGEATKKPNGVEYWKTASDKIVGAIAKGNAVSIGVFKSFLSWCDLLVRLMYKIHCARVEGFMLPIFYYEINLEKTSDDDDEKPVAEKIISTTNLPAQPNVQPSPAPAQALTPPTGRPRSARRLDLNNIKKEHPYYNAWNGTEEQSSSQQQLPPLESAENDESMNAFVLPNEFASMQEGNQVDFQFNPDECSTSVLVLDSELISDSQLFSFLDVGDNSVAIDSA